MHFAKIRAFSMKRTKLFAIFLLQLFEKFCFSKIQMNIYFVRFTEFLMLLQNFACTFFIISCNQKLGCGYNYSFHEIFVSS